jgi:hypothetical protein
MMIERHGLPETVKLGHLANCRAKCVTAFQISETWHLDVLYDKSMCIYQIKEHLDKK